MLSISGYSGVVVL